MQAIRQLFPVVSIFALAAAGLPAQEAEAAQAELPKLSAAQLDEYQALAMRVVDARSLPESVRREDFEVLRGAIGKLQDGATDAGLDAWNAFSKEFFNAEREADVDPIAGWVLRSSYLTRNRPLFDAADELRYYRELADGIREHIPEMREALIKHPKDGKGPFENLILRRQYQPSFPARISRQVVEMTRDELLVRLEEWEGWQGETDEAIRQATATLRETIQKQQQAMQTISQVSRRMQDAAMAAIRESKD